MSPFGSFDRVASMNGRGGILVVWQDGTTVNGRLLSPDNAPRGPAFEISEPTSSWRSGPRRGGSAPQVYRPTGETSRGPILVATGITDQQPLKISVAMDAAGRFLATWDCCRSTPVIPSKVFGRFFEASGLPLDRPFEVALRTPHQDSLPDAAGRPAGEFFVAWGRRIEEDASFPLIGRRLQWARRGDDLCRFSRGVFACDVVHDGSPPAVSVSFGEVGARPVLRGDRFLCDTAHDGGAAEIEISFGGSPGAIPLLGNLDGF